MASVIWRSHPGENVQVPLPGTYISVDELLSKPIAFWALVFVLLTAGVLVSAVGSGLSLRRFLRV